MYHIVNIFSWCVVPLLQMSCLFMCELTAACVLIFDGKMLFWNMKSPCL